MGMGKNQLSKFMALRKDTNLYYLQENQIDDTIDIGMAIILLELFKDRFKPSVKLKFILTWLLVIRGA
jgi:hypothetical protein